MLVPRSAAEHDGPGDHRQCSDRAAGRRRSLGCRRRPIPGQRRRHHPPRRDDQRRGTPVFDGVRHDLGARARGLPRHARAARIRRRQRHPHRLPRHRGRHLPGRTCSRCRSRPARARRRHPYRCRGGGTRRARSCPGRGERGGARSGRGRGTSRHRPGPARRDRAEPRPPLPLRPRSGGRGVGDGLDRAAALFRLPGRSSPADAPRGQRGGGQYPAARGLALDAAGRPDGPAPRRAPLTGPRTGRAARRRRTP